MSQDFKHVQAAHCENGVTTNLLNHYGVDLLTEPLAFGMGSGLLYLHIPFMLINGAPAITYRTIPGAIFKRTCSALKISVTSKKFSSTAKAQSYLDDLLERNIPVGCQVGVYHLPYFAPEYRFHFNAHNLVIYGKENGKYLISDPTMETVTELTEEELETVRFAKGAFAPKGHLYYPENVSKINEALLRKGIMSGIKKNVRDMLYAPGSFIGVSGIKYTARKIKKWRSKLGPRKAGLYLGQIVRMQEEIGTGGAGFRYIYAAFLEESGIIMQNDKFQIASDMFTEIGDLWRTSAVTMAGIYKGKNTEQKDFEHSADLMIEISEREKEAFKYLKKLKV